MWHSWAHNGVAMTLLFTVACLSSPTLEPDPDWADDDFDHDGFDERKGDCDDTDPNVWPGAPELCNGHDDDCDAVPDEDAPFWFQDSDKDGLGDPANTIADCEQPAGYVSNSADCNDKDSEYPKTFFGDMDGDGDGVSELAAVACWDMAASGLSSRGDDCDDSDPLKHHATRWYSDEDGDGLGNPFPYATGCVSPDASFVLTPDDCNDDPDGKGKAVGPDCAWRDIAVTENAACGVRGNGLIVCWGADDVSFVVDSPADEPFVSIDVSDAPTSSDQIGCGITEHGELRCWGEDWLEEGVDAGGTYSAVAVGVDHVCGLDMAGAISCWGDPARTGSEDTWVTNTPSGSGFIAIDAGEYISVALDAEGGVHHWGNASWIPGDRTSDTLPAECKGGAALSDACENALLATLDDHGPYDGIALERTRVCAYTANEVQCAGAPVDVDDGGSAELAPPPHTVFTGIAVGPRHTCTFTSDGGIQCGGRGNPFTDDDMTDYEFSCLGAPLAGGADCACAKGLVSSEERSERQYTIQCRGVDKDGVMSPPS